MNAAQDKQKEIEFFDRHAEADDYDVFTAELKMRIIDSFRRMTGLASGARVADLGCGSGAFTALLRDAGYNVTGIDISSKLVAVGRAKYPGLDLIEGDAENLPFAAGGIDGVMLSGLVHHFPDPRKLVAETHRVLRRDGRFMAFDPNRMNPFMWAYRDRASPFYSPVGVTENERPILAHETATIFRQTGFQVTTDYLSGMAYRYVSSARTRLFLPIYNAIDRTVFGLPFMAPFRPFVLTSGVKS